MNFLDSIGNATGAAIGAVENFFNDGTLNKSSKHRFDSFALPRKGAYANWYIDGRDYFLAVSEAISHARQEIFIEDWWLSPELYLRRPPSKNEEYRLDNLLKRKAEEGVKIYVVVYKEVSQALTMDSAHSKHALSSLHPNIVVQRHPDHLVGGTVFWAHHEKICVVDRHIAFIGGLDLCFGRYDTNEHQLADYHPHSNLMEIWPGQDYSNPRIKDFADVQDVAKHFIERWNFIKKEKAENRPEVKVLVYKSDAQHDREDPPQARNYKYFGTDIQAHHYNGTVNIQILRSSSKWSHGIETEKSIQNAYLDTIKNAKHFIYIENQFFITATKESEKFPVKNLIGKAIVERVLRAAKNNERFRIIVCMPLLPAFPCEVDSKDAGTLRLVMNYQYKSICRGGYSILEEIRKANVDPSKYIAFFSLRNYDRVNPSAVRKGLGALSNPSVGGEPVVPHGVVDDDITGNYITEELYIHTKLLIADDKYVIIGSANLNDRSQLGDHDSEIAALIEDTDTIDSELAGRPYKAAKFAATLRRTVFKEHLGLLQDHEHDKVTLKCHPPPHPLDPSVVKLTEADSIVKDPASDKFIAYWNSRAKTNTEAFREVFHCFPDDTVTTWEEYKAFSPDREKIGLGHVCKEDYPLQSVKENLSKIQGHLVEFPTHFLEKEELQGSVIFDSNGEQQRRRARKKTNLSKVMTSIDKEIASIATKYFCERKYDAALESLELLAGRPETSTTTTINLKGTREQKEIQEQKENIDPIVLHNLAVTQYYKGNALQHQALYETLEDVLSKIQVNNASGGIALSAYGVIRDKKTEGFEATTSGDLTNIKNLMNSKSEFDNTSSFSFLEEQSNKYHKKQDISLTTQEQLSDLDLVNTDEDLDAAASDEDEATNGIGPYRYFSKNIPHFIDEAIPLYNKAAIYFQLKRYEGTRDIIEPFLRDNIDRLEEYVACRISWLLMEVYIELCEPAKASQILEWLELKFRDVKSNKSSTFIEEKKFSDKKALENSEYNRADYCNDQEEFLIDEIQKEKQPEESTKVKNDDKVSISNVFPNILKTVPSIYGSPEIAFHTLKKRINALHQVNTDQSKYNYQRQYTDKNSHIESNKSVDSGDSSRIITDNESSDYNISDIEIELELNKAYRKAYSEYLRKNYHTSLEIMESCNKVDSGANGTSLLKNCHFHPRYLVDASSSLLFNTGLSYFANGMYENALQCFEKAAEVREIQSSPWVWIRIGECCLNIYDQITSFAGKEIVRNERFSAATGSFPPDPGDVDYHHPHLPLLEYAISSFQNALIHPVFNNRNDNVNPNSSSRDVTPNVETSRQQQKYQNASRRTFSSMTSQETAIILRSVMIKLAYAQIRNGLYSKALAASQRIIDEIDQESSSNKTDNTGKDEIDDEMTNNRTVEFDDSQNQQQQ
ncbi:1850_t:CDS:10 [Ambispora gerdemannii]|uniref:phospholipase D n=1 Tax=Ambispora gerdemannii TaxID=144530 RepID=A0A9N8VNL6_9GLOM|nr:1850_t:CDS:10 [Ambispora gerdemannii]